MGQFTQLDPIGMFGGLNLYGYANSDPVNFSDPSGLIIESRNCEFGQSVLTCEAGLELLDDSGWDVVVLAGPCGRRGWCPESIEELMAIPGFESAVAELWGRTAGSMESDPDGIGREYGAFILRLPSNRYRLGTIFPGVFQGNRILGLPRQAPANAIAFIHTHPLYGWNRTQTGRVYNNTSASPADIENARIRQIWMVTVSANRLHFVSPAGTPVGYRPRN